MSKQKTKTRLYVPQADLRLNGQLILQDKHYHYLCHVLRAKVTDVIGVFNGQSDEYAAQIIAIDKKIVTLKIISSIRTFQPAEDITLMFALIKKGPIDYLVQKATELGVGTLRPILTERTIIRQANLSRLETIAIEAAEQCGLTALPNIMPLIFLKEALISYDRVLFCNERGDGTTIKDFLSHHGTPQAILIGPEGGFTSQEADFLTDHPATYPITLGPRIMRAETAAIAALSAVQLYSL